MREEDGRFCSAAQWGLRVTVLLTACCLFPLLALVRGVHL